MLKTASLISAFILTLFLCNTASAQVLLRHDGMTDPTLEGFELFAGGHGKTGPAPDGQAWYIDDESSHRYGRLYRIGFDDADLDGAMQRGWSLRWSVKVVKDYSVGAATNGIFVSYGFKGARDSVYFGMGGDRGAILKTSAHRNLYYVPDSIDEYVDCEVRFDPSVDNLVRLFVNGIEVYADDKPFTGTGGYINFGSYHRREMARSNWRHFSFRILGDETDLSVAAKDDEPLNRQILAMHRGPIDPLEESFRAYREVDNVGPAEDGQGWQTRDVERSSSSTSYVFDLNQQQYNDIQNNGWSLSWEVKVIDGNGDSSSPAIWANFGVGGRHYNTLLSSWEGAVVGRIWSEGDFPFTLNDAVGEFVSYEIRYDPKISTEHAFLFINGDKVIAHKGLTDRENNKQGVIFGSDHYAGVGTAVWRNVTFSALRNQPYDNSSFIENHPSASFVPEPKIEWPEHPVLRTLAMMEYEATEETPAESPLQEIKIYSDHNWSTTDEIFAPLDISHGWGHSFSDIRVAAVSPSGEQVFVGSQPRGVYSTEDSQVLRVQLAVPANPEIGFYELYLLTTAADGTTHFYTPEQLYDAGLRSAIIVTEPDEGQIVTDALTPEEIANIYHAYQNHEIPENQIVRMIAQGADPLEVMKHNIEAELNRYKSTPVVEEEFQNDEESIIRPGLELDVEDIADEIYLVELEPGFHRRVVRPEHVFPKRDLDKFLRFKILGNSNPQLLKAKFHLKRLVLQERDINQGEALIEIKGFRKNGNDKKLIKVVVKRPEVERDFDKPMLMMITHGFSAWGSEIAPWTHNAALTAAYVNARQRLARLDPDARPVKIAEVLAIVEEKGDNLHYSDVLKVWKGSRDFLILDWTIESNDGVDPIAILDPAKIVEIEHRSAVKEAKKAAKKLLEAWVEWQQVENGHDKVDILFVSHSFGTMVARDTVRAFNKSPWSKNVDFSKVVQIDSVAVKAQEDAEDVSPTHDRRYWFHPEFTGFVSAVSSFYQDLDPIIGGEHKIVVANLAGMYATHKCKKAIEDEIAKIFDTAEQVVDQYVPIFDEKIQEELDKLENKINEDVIEEACKVETGEFSLAKIAGGIVGSLFDLADIGVTGDLDKFLDASTPLDSYDGGGPGGYYNKQARIFEYRGEGSIDELGRFRHRNVLEKISKNEMISVAYSPDGQMIATGDDGGKIIIRSTANFEDILHIKHEERVNSLAFTPDGNRLISLCGKEDEIRVTDVASEQTVWSAELKDARRLAQSADGSLLAVANADGRVVVWQGSGSGSYQELAQVEVHTGSIRQLVFSDDGTLFVAGKDGLLVAFDGTSLTLKHSHQYEKPIFDMLLMDDGVLITAVGKSLNFLNYDQVNGFESLGFINKHKRRVTSLARSTDGSQFISGDLGKRLNIFSYPHVQLKAFRERGQLPIRRIAYRPNSYQFATTSYDKIGGPVRDHNVNQQIKDRTLAIMRWVEPYISHVTAPDVYVEDVLAKGREPFFWKRFRRDISKPAVLKTVVSHSENVTLEAAANDLSEDISVPPASVEEGPRVIIQIEDFELHSAGDPIEYNLGNVFSVPAGQSVEYEVSTSNPNHIAVLRSGLNVTLRPLRPGKALVSFSALTESGFADVRFYIDVFDDSTDLVEEMSTSINVILTTLDQVGTARKNARNFMDSSEDFIDAGFGFLNSRPKKAANKLAKAQADWATYEEKLAKAHERKQWVEDALEELPPVLEMVRENRRNKGIGLKSVEERYARALERLDNQTSKLSELEADAAPVQERLGSLEESLVSND